MSATSRNMVISSGRLKNLAKRVFNWNFVPSGVNSIAVVVSPNVEAHASKDSNPFAFNKSY